MKKFRNQTIAKRIGYNAQQKIDKRNKFIQSPVVQITMFISSAVVLLSAFWFLFSIAIILDPSNQYYN